MISRRNFLSTTTATAAALAATGCRSLSSKPVRVRVWDERQPAQKKAYPNWLGNQIAEHLRTVPGLQVESVCLDDPDQGLNHLEDIDVLVWWGHVRQMEIERPTALRIVYFRPGHETYPVYTRPLALRVVENSVLWLAS